MHDLQALSIRNHRVELASDVKILGTEEAADTPGTAEVLRLCQTCHTAPQQLKAIQLVKPAVAAATLTHW